MSPCTSNCRTFGLGSESQGNEGEPEANKTGMSLKQKEMPICDRPINVWWNQEVGDFVPRDAGETNPRGLRYTVRIRYRNSGKNEPKPVILSIIYLLQWKSARFPATLNANDLSRIPPFHL